MKDLKMNQKPHSTIGLATRRNLVPTERTTLAPLVVYDVYNEDDGFRHRLTVAGKHGEWKGYTQPATFVQGPHELFVVTEFYAGALETVIPGRLYQIRAVNERGETA